MIRAVCWLAVAGLAVCATHVSSAPLPRAEPAAAGLSAEGLVRLRAELDALVERGAFPGIVGMVARRGKVAFAHATGQLDVETGAAMQLDSLLRIYSMTKPITSVAAMLLVEDGALELDAPVARWLPEWRKVTVLVGDERVPAATPITVRHLLTHTAGLSYGYYGDTEVDRLYRAAGLIDDWDYLTHDTRELVAKLAHIPLLFQPGARWHYGFATDRAGPSDRARKRRTPGSLPGAPPIRPARHDGRLFRRARTGTAPVRHRSHRRRGRYGHRAGQPARDAEFIGVTFISGGGGLVTTVGDYMRFCLMLANGGATPDGQLLQEATIADMTANQLPADSPMQFGLGFAIAREGANGPLSPGAYYWGGAAGTFFWVDPAQQLIGIFMPQRIGMPNAVQGRLQQLVYDALAD